MGRVSKVWKFFHRTPQVKDKAICNVCDASFVSNFRLSTHQKIHYQCNICKVYLLSDFHLRSHIEDQHVTKARNDKQDSKLGFD